MSDVVDRARGGDPVAFELIHRQYSVRIRRHIRSIVTDPTVTDDLVQATWERAWLRITNTRPGTLHIQAWLYRIATNLAIDYIRQLGKRNTVSLDQVVEAPPSAKPTMHPVAGGGRTPDDPGDIVALNDRQALVEAALSTLSPIEVDVLCRRADGQSSRSIADQLGMTNADVLQIFASARIKARSNIANQSC